MWYEPVKWAKKLTAFDSNFSYLELSYLHHTQEGSEQNILTHRQMVI